MNLDQPIALTCGDPAGVGPEIARRWLEAHSEDRDIVVPVGPAPWIDSLGLDGEACPAGDRLFEPGRPCAEGARAAWEALQLAAQGCLDGRYRGVVTGPVSKAELQAVGYPFPGQTEFFADAWGGVPSMAFAGRELQVVLATWHEPLAGLADHFREDPDLLDRAVLNAVHWAQQDGIREPRIGVCGLNPHAGEGGLLGAEEKELLDPRLDILRELHPGVSRCLPADTVFYRQREGEFDRVVALYHDQGLIPVKTLEFHAAVNVTLGLPFLRASPDHGTAFHLAGKSIARIDSFGEALRLVDRLTAAKVT